MRTDGGQEGEKFSNTRRSQTVAIEVYLKFELAVFVLNTYFLCRSVWAKNQAIFYEQGTCTKCGSVFPIHAQLIWYVYCILFTESAFLRPYIHGTITLCVIETDRIRCVHNSKFIFRKKLGLGRIYRLITQGLSVRQYTVLMLCEKDVPVWCVFPIR